MNIIEQLEVVKRTVTVGGKETSIALERAFWAVIDAHAKGADDWRVIVQKVVKMSPDPSVPLARLLRVWCLNRMFARVPMSPSRSR